MHHRALRILTVSLALSLLPNVPFLPHVVGSADAAPATGFGRSGDPSWLKVDIPANNGAGEPTLGVGWTLPGGTTVGGAAAVGTTAMFMGRLSQFRVTFDDASGTASPTTATHPYTLPIGFDPILYTDFQTGRTWAGELELAGAGLVGFIGNVGCTNMAYTDDNGLSWHPVADACSLPAYDHETVGSGPWAGGPPAVPPGAYPHIVYYCSQQVFAFCWTSSDGGLTFSPPAGSVAGLIPATCGGLHGHVRVAQDGTAYVPNKNCGGKSGFAYSTNNGVSWGFNTITAPGASGTGAFDPSIGISLQTATGGASQRIYFGQAEAGGLYVGVSDNRGLTWNTGIGSGNSAPAATKYYNLLDAWNDVHAAADDLHQAEFAEVISGDLDRAAVAFLGTTTQPWVQNKNACGTASGITWNLYEAFTDDGGVTWDVQKASPDVVQKDGIWAGGGTSACRNLLDFNDIVVDVDGRVLVAYADGCTGTCDGTSGTGTGLPADHDQAGVLLRQSKGCGLFAAKDVPGGGCNSVTGTTGTPLTASAGGPYSGTAGTAISITGTATGGTTPYACSWSSTSSPAPTFASPGACSTTVNFGTPGTKSVKVTVTDAVGTVDVSTATVTVTPAALVANAGGTYAGVAGKPILVTGSASGGLAPYSCSWTPVADFTGSTTACSTTVQYAAAGTYTITLTAGDSQSPSASDTDTATVTVTAAVPCVLDPAADQFAAPADVPGLFDLRNVCAQKVGTNLEVTIETTGQATEATLGTVLSPVTYTVHVNSKVQPWVLVHALGAWTVTDQNTGAVSGTATAVPGPALVVTIPLAATGAVTGVYVGAEISQAGKGLFVGMDRAPNAGNIGV